MIQERVIKILLVLVVVLGWLALADIAEAADIGQDEFLYARKLLEEEYYDLAAEQLERVLRDFPGMPNVHEVQYLLGEAYLLAGKPDLARPAFLKTWIMYPDSPWAPEAMYQVGAALEAEGSPVDAARNYMRIHSFFPQHRRAPEGLLNAMQLYLVQRDTIQTQHVIDLLVDNYPESESADAARLLRGSFYAASGDDFRTGQYFEWVATRSNSDSLSGIAWISLGDLYRENWRLNDAEKAYTKGIERSADSGYSSDAIVKLADLMTYRGRPKEAIALLESYKDSRVGEELNTLRIEMGDAYFKIGDYKKAIGIYNSASSNPVAALKAAWTAEILHSLDTAFERYKSVAYGSTSEASQAMLRAALVAGRIGKTDEAISLWEKVLSDDESVSEPDRAWFEYLKLRRSTGMSISAVADTILVKYPQSPLADDAAYWGYMETFGNALQVDNSEITSPDKFLDMFPASPFADTLRAAWEFYSLHRLRSNNLMERMAELSSRPQNSVSSIRWALDWGDFYLDDFKDPVKAIDQFDTVLENPKAPSRAVEQALGRSVEGYQALYESAYWEADTFAMSMYGDSARHRLSMLNTNSNQLTDHQRLDFEQFRLDLMASHSDSSRRFGMIKSGWDLFDRLGMEVISPSNVWLLLSVSPLPDSSDSIGISSRLKLVEETILRSNDVTLIDRLKAWETNLQIHAGDYSTGNIKPDELLNELSRTPIGGSALWSVMETGYLSPRYRLDLLRECQRLLPYLVDSYELALLKADLLDSLRRPLEALEAREEAVAAAAWGRPDLDILDNPNAATLLKYAQTYFASKMYLESEEKLTAILSLFPHEEQSAAAYLLLAQLDRYRGRIDTALTHIDSLIDRFPQSAESSAGRHLKARLLMDGKSWSEARILWLELGQQSAVDDSIIVFISQAIVCQYRMGDAESARTSAKRLYKRFRDRDDLDQYKALFYLEKGRNLEKSRQFDEARKQYKIVLEKYELTKWTAEAAYSHALSQLAQGKYEEGSEELAEFVDNYPSSYLRWNGMISLGLAAYRAENYPEAAKVLSRIWNNQDGEEYWITAFRALLAVYKDSRYWDAVLRLTREYLTRFPEAPDAIDMRMDIGWAYIQIGEWDEAIRHYRSLLPLADAEREAEVQFYIGEAHQANGDYQTAILEFLKVRILGRKTKLDWGITAIYKAGNCYEKLGDMEGAARMYQRIIAERGPESNYGRTAQERLDEMNGGG